MPARVGQQRLRPGISPVDSYLYEVPQDAATEFFGIADPAVGGFDVGSRSRGPGIRGPAGDRLFAGRLCAGTRMAVALDARHAPVTTHTPARLHPRGGTGSTTSLPKHAVLQRDLRTDVRTISSAETTPGTSSTGSRLAYTMPGGHEDPLIWLSERMVSRAEQRAAAASQPAFTFLGPRRFPTGGVTAAARARLVADEHRARAETVTARATLRRPDHPRASRDSGRGSPTADRTPVRATQSRPYRRRQPPWMLTRAARRAWRRFGE
jgi:hypothetical protein